MTKRKLDDEFENLPDIADLIDLSYIHTVTVANMKYKECVGCSKKMNIHNKHINCMLCQYKNKINKRDKRIKLLLEKKCITCKMYLSRNCTTSQCKKCLNNAKNYYDKIKLEHKCYKCFNILPDDYKYKWCVYCKNKQKMKYDTRKRNKQCVECKIDLPDTNTFARCIDCRSKFKKYREKYNVNKEILKKEHKCIICKEKMPDTYTYFTCATCREHKNSLVNKNKKK